MMSEPNEGAHALTDLVTGMADLEPGVEYKVSGNWCRHCQSTELVLVMKLEAAQGSLAGVQVKTAATARPWLRCKGCGRESRGSVRCCQDERCHGCGSPCDGGPEHEDEYDESLEVNVCTVCGRESPNLGAGETRVGS